MGRCTWGGSFTNRILVVHITKNFENLKIFEKLLLKNAIKIWGIFSIKFFGTFSTKNILFDCITPFLAERKLRFTNIKLKIAIKLRNTDFYGVFSAF